jgi:hypothetical protein
MTKKKPPAQQWWEGGRAGRDLAPPVAVRLPVGLAGDVERKAAEVGLRTSGQLRRMVEFANQNMPKEWGL